LHHVAFGQRKGQEWKRGNDPLAKVPREVVEATSMEVFKRCIRAELLDIV